MASYTQLQTTYPYFCQSGPIADATTNINTIKTSATFWNNGTNLERGSSCITTNTASGLVFTAPVNGLYYFEIILNCINNSAVGDDSGSWGITITRASPLTNSDRFINVDPGNIATTTTEYNVQFSTNVYLNATDTVKMYSAGFGGGDNEIYLANKCYFMGYLVAGFN